MLQEGKILKIIREKLGYSQEDLASFLSIKREIISYYETGTREVPLEILEKLATLFGVDLEIFFSEQTEDLITNMAFAFRAEHLKKQDLEAIAGFRKIVLNYQRMLKLEQKNAKR